MQSVFNTIQIVLGVLLIIVILIQQKGAGIGSTFGGEMGMYRTKRGAEKMLFRLTIILGTLFIMASIAGLVL